MKALMTAMGLALCWPASAGLINDILRIDYEGTVSSVDGTQLDQAVGDHIAGTLIVDLGRTPRDAVASPWRSHYFTFPPDGDSRFVTGYAPVDRITYDEVFVSNAEFGSSDEFTVVDSEFGRVPPTGNSWKYFEDSLWLSARQATNFLDDDGIVQSFDLSGADVGRGMLSKTREHYDGTTPVPGTFIGGLVEFVLQKFTVRPGRCTT